VLTEEVLAIIALAETGSVTSAAALRHVTQPALTRQLQRLAARVGAPLVERRGRRVLLTAAGEAVAAAARRQAADWEATLQALRGTRHAPLRLGAGATVALTLLPGALARLRAELPELALQISSGDSAVTAARCLSGELDAGLVTTAAADPRLLALPVGVDPVVAIGPPVGPDRLSLRELALGPLCLYARGTGFRSLLEELFAGAGLFPHPVAEMDGMEALRELVAAGIGRSLLPRSVVAGALAEGRIRQLGVDGLPQVSRTIALLRRAGRPPHPVFAALAAALVATAQRVLPERAGGAPEAR